jgi:hypothetical protein
MSADRFDPPKIMFMGQPENGMSVQFAYLVRIDGQPWAFADLREIHKPPHETTAFPLDPTRIVEETSTETGQPVFAYRAKV